MRLLILSAAALLTAAPADAGPFRRRPATCAGGSCQVTPAVAFQAPAPVAAGPAVTAAPACVGGSCAAPVVVRRGLFR